MAQPRMARQARSLPYHHGNLRAALVQTALELLERKGPEALTLRELAVAAGVSNAAPYRHFPDRAALLNAVAAEGYQDLRQRHADALAEGGPPKARLRRAMHAFLAFARERPGLFLLMYSPPVGTIEGDPALQALEAQAYEDLVRAFAACVARQDEHTARLRTITLWATVYGHAMVRLRHPLQPVMKAGLDDAQIDELILDAALGQRAA